MARQMDNSLVAFARRPSVVPQVLLSIVVFVCLIGSIAFALSWGEWQLAVLIAFGTVAAFAFAWYSIDQYRRLASSRDQKRIDWQAALPDVQRQNLNVEVHELSKILDADGAQIADLQSAFIVAEDLALRQIQQEENVPLLRHVTIADVPFDAVFVKGETIVCGETSFLVTPELRQEKVDAMLRKIRRVKDAIAAARLSMRVQLMIILVTQLSKDNEDDLRAELDTRRFSSTPVDIDIRLLDFEALQRIYVTD